MKRTHFYGVLVASSAAWVATHSPYGTQLAVLAVAVGIFLGTVSIRGARAGDATSTHPGV